MLAWFVFLLVISCLLYQHESAALHRLFLVHFLKLLVSNACIDDLLRVFSGYTFDAVALPT